MGRHKRSLAHRGSSFTLRTVQRGGRKGRGERGACILHDVRPYACASIFHSAPCFENVYARVPVRVMVWPLMVTVSVPAMTAYASEPSTFQNPISYDRCSCETPKVLTPLFYVSKPIGRSVWVQPAIRCDAVDDDGGLPKNAEEKVDILGVETVDVIVDKGLDFSSGGVAPFPAREPQVAIPPQLQ